ncbi:MAG: DHHA1 domain-containing protein [Deinococcota bacterium]|nr:DHHA1 domain-containing protein [Deinococcota bacterium]
MATERLYREQPYQTSFESEVLKVREAEDGHWILLGRTLFYPRAGGQPHDLGTLKGRRVLDVRNEGDRVWHLLEGDPLQAGETVAGKIDWPRRYRHMQRHSGQHLLSQAFVRVNPVFATQAVSLSGPVCTLDLAGGPEDEDLAAAERVVNEAAYANYPIEAFELASEDLKGYSPRRSPQVAGLVRLVAMGDWELSACGGTHLRSTAEAAPVKLLRLERVKAELARVHFRCGLEAIADYSLKHRLAYGLATSLSVGVEELPERVAALQSELGKVRHDLGGVQSRHAAEVAVRLLAQAEKGRYGRVVAHTLPPEDADLLKPLVQALAREDDVIVLLASPQAGRAQLLFARGERVEADMKALLALALPFVAGRGGGRAELAQGSGSRPGGTAEALAYVRAQLLG